MKKMYLFLALFILMFEGCASLDKVSYYNNSGTWETSSLYYSYEEMPFKIYWNKYEGNNISIYLSPHPLLGRNLALSFSYLPVMIPDIFSLAYQLIAPDTDSLVFETIVVAEKKYLCNRFIEDIIYYQ
ncbi:MAG: hypothetical protein P4L27_07605 [Ignavibacteriaceae bacterium]|nr:hypothetical protein [Ignavibacteriaceae bacterium]